MYDLKNKVVLITGASAGIGAGVVRSFLDEGAKHIAILDVDLNGKAFAEELNTRYGADKVKFYKCDVTSNDLHDAYDDVLNNFGYIDVVVNNAGILNDSPKVYEKEIAVNVTALITSSLKAYNLMRKDHNGKGGTIVNISSIVALCQGPLFPIYNATKSAVLQFSNCLGMEPNYSMTGVRIVTVCFGCTDTSLFSKAKIEAHDQETNSRVDKGLNLLPWQTVESAVKGLLEAYKKGESASTWLVSANRPAEEITNKVRQAYQILGEGLLKKETDL